MSRENQHMNVRGAESTILKFSIEVISKNNSEKTPGSETVKNGEKNTHKNTHKNRYNPKVLVENWYEENLQKYGDTYPFNWMHLRDPSTAYKTSYNDDFNSFSYGGIENGSFIEKTTNQAQKKLRSARTQHLHPTEYSTNF